MKALFRSVMKKALCPECGEEILCPQEIFVGSHFLCTNCGADLEVVVVKEDRIIFEIAPEN